MSNGSFATDRQGKYWYMGPTSSWAFCQRVLAVIHGKSSDQVPVVKPRALESVSLQWNPIGLHEQPEVSNLPSAEYAALLHSTVKYHLGSLYDIIDHECFSRQIDRFYRDPVTEARRSRFWYAQFLFVLAFGEAFTSTGAAGSGIGLKYASRALSLLPCIVPLDENPLPAVEALCLAALYLQAIDSRLMAFQMIGQALRVCVIEGWHRYMPSAEVASSHSRRCTSIFWTAYMIDREFGTLIGAPSSIRDEDITVELPSGMEPSLEKSEVLTLQVKLARLTAMILTGVYGADRSSRGTLLADTQSALHSIARIDEDLLAYLDTRFKGTDIRTSKVATNLILSYHHCVVLVTRPLVMCMLHKYSANRGTRLHLPEAPVMTLLQSSTWSALNILRTLKALAESNMLDHFLSFQLEAAFSSAVMLCIIDKLLPGFISDDSWLHGVYEILGIMISKGSPAAPLRRQEFERLHRVTEAYIRGKISATEPPLDAFASWGPLEHYSDFTLSSTDIMQMANGLQAEDFWIQD
ncbi:hypothetical protein BJY04DRAFT_231248 [Aspergillus karnatakaensis]|uniref:fungal specific transcription factor domain-containing protein n=1 Tax=Aspergillus karnatakaensis TaxID=1810916 RepID=UPI003CCCF79F